jgi:NitT/TauT family transport system permease protein
VNAEGVASLRPEFERVPADAGGIGAVVRPLPALERLRNNVAVRRGLILVSLGLLWQFYAMWLGNPLLFPTLTETVGVLVRDLVTGELLNRIATSLEVLVIGYAAGVA